MILKFPLDLKIVDFLRDQPEAVSSWRLVNAVAAARHPVNRDESQELKMRILRRITPLIYANGARRVGRGYLGLRGISVLLIAFPLASGRSAFHVTTLLKIAVSPFFILGQRATGEWLPAKLQVGS